MCSFMVPQEWACQCHGFRAPASRRGRSLVCICCLYGVAPFNHSAVVDVWHIGGGGVGGVHGGGGLGGGGGGVHGDGGLGGGVGDGDGGPGGGVLGGLGVRDED